MRNNFDKQLATLNCEMIAMGTSCEEAIAMSAKALCTGDLPLAERVRELSEQIEKKEREVEGLCLRLLLQQQPVAGDLRTISSALKMITDMKRIGVQSADIAEIIITAHICAGEDDLNIGSMAKAAIKMVTDSVNAFVKKDLEAAFAVIEYDDVVDGYFDTVKKLLIEKISQSETGSENALDFLMIAKYFERIADHAVNVAKWVIFSITGSREGAD